MKPDFSLLPAPDRSVEVRRAIPRAWKNEALIRSGGTCAYPGCEVRTGLQFDHMLALGLGGKHAAENIEPLVTAASAEARIAELEVRIEALEAERSQIAGESIWWRAVIGDGEYAPSGEVPSIKHLHPATVKPIYEAHKGTAVADVIAGLIFSRAITENREQFLVGCANGRAQAAEARADRLARVVVDLKKAFGDPMTRRALGGHSETQQAAILAASAALQQEG